MAADKEPNDLRFIHSSQSPIMYPNPDGIEIFGSSEFFEIEALVGRVYFESTICVFRLLSNFRGKRVKALPKLSRRFRFDQ